GRRRAFGGAGAWRKLGDERPRRLTAIREIERFRSHQRRRSQERRDVHDERQQERHPDAANRDEVASIRRVVAPIGNRRKSGGAHALFLMRSLPRSPIMIVGALVLPPMRVGMTDASTTRSAETPRTRNCGSTTAPSSTPIRHVPTGW